MAILAAILFMSSSVSYSAFANRLENRFRGQGVMGMMQLPPGYLPPRQQDLLNDLFNSLLVVNGILLVTAGAASYLLAGVTLEPIQAAYEKQKRFLSDASHELRTPLSILKLTLENRLSEADAGDTEKAGIRSNLEEVDRMSDIVSGLLSLSRLEDAQKDEVVNAQKVDLQTALSKTVERFQVLAKDHQVNLQSPSFGSERIEVWADPALLDQVLGNVVKNAIAYNKPGGGVEMQIQRDHDQTILKIKDTGVGIAPQDLPKVFDRFYRADTSRSRKTGGSGLGLPIVKSAMRRMGGKVEMASAVGQGTTVSLSFKSS